MNSPPSHRIRPLLGRFHVSIWVHLWTHINVTEKKICVWKAPHKQGTVGEFTDEPFHTVQFREEVGTPMSKMEEQVDVSWGRNGDCLMFSRPLAGSWMQLPVNAVACCGWWERSPASQRMGCGHTWKRLAQMLARSQTEAIFMEHQPIQTHLGSRLLQGHPHVSSILSLHLMNGHSPTILLS